MNMTADPVAPEKDAIDTLIDGCPVLTSSHRRLIQELPQLARVANIPQHMVYEPMSAYVDDEVIEWLQRLRYHVSEGCYGLWMTQAVGKKSVVARMQSIAAACLRNYIDARVMVAADIVKALHNDTMPEPTVLLIPDFWDGWALTAPGAQYKAQRLLEILMHRQVAGLVTILFARDLNEQISTVFGTEISHILSTYTKTK